MLTVLRMALPSGRRRGTSIRMSATTRRPEPEVLRTEARAEIVDMWIGSSERNVHELSRRPSGPHSACCSSTRSRRPGPGAQSDQELLHAQRGEPAGHRAGLTRLGQRGRLPAGGHNQPYDVDPAWRRPDPPDRTLLGAAARRPGPGVDLPHAPGPPPGGGYRPANCGRQVRRLVRG